MSKITVLTLSALLLISTKVFGQLGGGYHYNPLHANGIHPSGLHYFFGDSLPDTTVSGVVSIDSTYFSLQYFIDTDTDQETDFLLAFGPWWYEPDGVSRPYDGEIVTVKGKVFHSLSGNVTIIVEELNGNLWRNLDQNFHWSGGWITVNQTDTGFVYCPVDSASFIAFMPGMIGMGGMWGSKFYVDMNQLANSLMPDGENPNMILGFHFEFISENGQDMMHGNWGGMGNQGHGRMMFQQNTIQRFHYDQDYIDEFGFDEEQLILCYWDKENSVWVQFPSLLKEMITGTTINTGENYIELKSTEVFDNIAIFKPDIINDIDEGQVVVKEYHLLEAYPNPFNPDIFIKFTLPKSAPVSLNIYNIEGQHIRSLQSGEYISGRNTVTVSWDGRNTFGAQVSSGIYLIQLKYDKQKITKKITLIK